MAVDTRFAGFEGERKVVVGGVFDTPVGVDGAAPGVVAGFVVAGFGIGFGLVVGGVGLGFVVFCVYVRSWNLL